MQVGIIGGSSLAALLLSIISAQMRLVIDGLTFIFSAYLLYTAKFHKVWIEEKVCRKNKDNKKVDFKILGLVPGIAMLTSLAQITISMFNFLGPILGKKLTNSPIFFAQMDVACAVGAMASGLLLSYLFKGNISFRKNLPFLAVLGVLLFFLLTLSNKLEILIVSFAIGYVTTHFAIILRSLIQLSIDLQQIGRVAVARLALETIVIFGVSSAMIVFSKQFTSLNINVVLVCSGLLVVAAVILTP